MTSLNVIRTASAVGRLKRKHRNLYENDNSDY
jgi:hypothetical protein